MKRERIQPVRRKKTRTPEAVEDIAVDEPDAGLLNDVDELLEVVSHTFGKQNMPGIPTAHHALRDIDTCTGEIGSVIYVRNLVHRPAMNPHPHADVRIIFQGFGYFHGALDRSLQAVGENQRHPIARWQSNQLARRFRRPKLIGASNNLVEPLLQFALFIDEPLRIAHQIYEQDVRNL